MPFQESRLYAILRWLFAGTLGLIFTIFSYAVLFPYFFSCCTVPTEFQRFFGITSVSILGISVILLSVWFALPMISLVLAMWGTITLGFVLNIFIIPQPAHILIRLGIHVMIACISGMLWYAYGKNKDKPQRYLFLQVIAVMSLLWALCLLVIDLI